MNPKSKSKMIKALWKWFKYRSDINFRFIQAYSKSEITKLFNEAITKRNEK